MSNRHYGRAVSDAVAGIDPELLYDAGVYHAPRIKRYAKPLIAAVISLMLIASAVIAASVFTVRSYLTVDTNSGVTVELNRYGAVVRANAASPLYQSFAERCHLISAERAAEILIDGMSERGGLDSGRNAILFGMTDDSREICERLADDLDEDYCVIRADIPDEPAVQKLARKRRITVGKAAFIMALTAADQRLNEALLYRLPISELMILAQGRGIVPEGITVSGEIDRSACIDRDTAVGIARRDESGAPDSVNALIDTDGYRSVYYVSLTYGDRGVVCIIGAADGTVERRVESGRDSLEEIADAIRSEYIASAEDTHQPAETREPAGDSHTPTSPEASGIPSSRAQTQPQPSAPPTAAPTQKPTDPAGTVAETRPDTPAPTVQPDQPPTVPPTEPPAPDDDRDTDDYLSAELWSSGPLPIGYTVLDGTELCEDLRSYAGYLTHNPSAILLRSDEQRVRCRMEHPEIVMMKDGSFDGFNSDYFGDRALLLVRVTEKYIRDRSNFFVFLRNGSVLYIGVYKTDIPDANQYNPPYTATYGVGLNADDAAGIRQVKIVQLTYEEYMTLTGKR